MSAEVSRGASCVASVVNAEGFDVMELDHSGPLMLCFDILEAEREATAKTAFDMDPRLACTTRSLAMQARQVHRLNGGSKHSTNTSDIVKP
jgi:hypothetical protein